LAVESGYYFPGDSFILRFDEIVGVFELHGFFNGFPFDTFVLDFIKYFVKEAFDMFLSEFFLVVDVLSVIANFFEIGMIRGFSFFNNLISHVTVRGVIQRWQL